jgi:flagellar basal-body rod protein FlgG
MQALRTAATGMAAQSMNVEVISNNIANMNTVAFKRQRAEFQDLIYQNQRRAGAASSDANTIVPSGIQLGLGVRAAAVYRITEQGNLTTTGNSLDMAVQGKGWFQVEMPSGETAYTRAGSFQLSAEGKIVTADGYTVKGGGTIPKDALDITINTSGEILVKQAGQAQLQRVGQFELASFANDAGLQASGDNLFQNTTASGDPVTGTAGRQGFGTLLQGFLETSNVNTVQEVTNLITAQRAYEMNSKVIKAADEMMSSLNQMR